MQPKITEPKASLKHHYRKRQIVPELLNDFRQNLLVFIANLQIPAREGKQETDLRDFLNDAFYKEKYYINKKDTIDWAIHNGKEKDSKIGVLIEVKSTSAKAEMLTDTQPNTKALHELVLYYLRERIENNNQEIRHLIATNCYEWYIFDELWFDQNIFTTTFKKTYQDWKRSGHSTDDFYKLHAKPHIESLGNAVEFCKIDLRHYATADNKQLAELYKILSPSHLLKQEIANDANQLNRPFYNELLYILGIEERKDDKSNKKIIERLLPNYRHDGSLLENTIAQLDAKNCMAKVPNIQDFGNNTDEQTYSVALELCITWLNRLLFLKLLEGQLVKYHGNDRNYRFLTSDKITDFDELGELFFGVLAKHPSQRSVSVAQKFGNIPYLNSSLFEDSALENTVLSIEILKDRLLMPYMPNTVLQDTDGRPRRGNVKTLKYLFDFLDSYDFGSAPISSVLEDQAVVEAKRADVINAAVLGLIFEKLNGYKDGSFFTPSFITMYMCRQTIRRAIIQKFETYLNHPINNWQSLKNHLDNDYRDPAKRQAYNNLLNGIKICDPAVGSGHFLVSALNEMIAAKADLKLLQHPNGTRLKDYEISIENDELIVWDEEQGQDFRYIVGSSGKAKPHIQLTQETLFHEKQTIIENCLFGVDINPKSVSICQLRLWIELLKNAYYCPPPPEVAPCSLKGETIETPPSGGRGATSAGSGLLQTLPNIDINIKTGNSLVSRFGLDTDLNKALRSVKYNINQYRGFVNDYKNATNKEQKRGLQIIIEGIKNNFRTEIVKYTNPKILQLNKLKEELYVRFEGNALFGSQLSEKQIIERDNLTEKINKLSLDLKDTIDSPIYRNAFEWRFEFPEVLDDEGNFLGFDVVVGNPPYIKEYENRDAFNGLRQKECYQGKMDLWYMFGDLGLKLLKSNCTLCYIATNNWVTNAGASNFRDIVINNSRIVSLVDFGSFMVFDNAAIQTMIMSFENTNTTDNYSFDFRRLEGEKPNISNVLSLLDGAETTNTVYLTPTVNKISLIGKPLVFNTDENEILLDKIKAKQNFYLREKGDKKLNIQSELGQGIVAPQDFINKSSAETLNNKFQNGNGVFILSQKEFDDKVFLATEKTILKPHFSTEQLRKYYGSSQNNHWIIYTKSDVNKPNKETNEIPINNYPNIKRHLDNFKSVITSDFAPYGLHRAREQHFFEGEKIMVTRKCPKEPIFTYTDFDCFVSQTFFIIQSSRINLKYLTGLLNSKLIAFWLRRKGKMQGNNYQLDKEPLLEIPIYNPMESERDKIVSLVDKILIQKQQGEDSQALEAEIDSMVYELYDLTPAEIAVVEGQATIGK